MFGSLETYYTTNDGIELEIEIDYTISGGQKGILGRDPGECQPAIEPDCEIDLIRAITGKHDFIPGGEMWDRIEDEIKKDDGIIDICFEHMIKSQGDEY